MYRRYMLRIAEYVAKKEKARALFTGESVGQVASQTIDNMDVISKATNMLMLRPLVCLDKKEIVDKAKEIGTYETSILPHDDCCTVFMPKQPETRAKLEDIEDIEKGLDIDELFKQACENIA